MRRAPRLQANLKAATLARAPAARKTVRVSSPAPPERPASWQARRVLVLLLAAACLAGERAPADNASGDGPAMLELRASPIADGERRRMQRWHDDYTRLMASILRDWIEVARAADARPSARLISGCRRLGRSLEELDRRQLMAAPDRAASLHLDRALRTLGDAARSCTHGAYFLAGHQLDEAADAFAQLRGRLALYGLAP